MAEGLGVTGSLTVTGANGTFSCEYQSGGGSGSCTGPQGSFTW
jgi:hypothetical protein